MTRLATLALATATLAAGFAAPAFAAGNARITATVSIATQEMQVVVHDETGAPATTFTWTVSTGASGYATPTGEYQPTWLSRNHRSRQYNNAPMPYAVFFHNGYAVHATFDTNRLGQPASHGCVRLSPENASTFFDLVRTTGMENTEIVILN